MAAIARSTPNRPELSSPDHIRLIGVAFLSLGLSSLLMPFVTGLPVERLLTLLLILWGSGGVMVAYTARQNVYRMVFLGLAVFGVAAGFYYAISGTGQTGNVALFLATVFAGQGAGALLLGLRLRRSAPAWGWLAWCGGFSIVLAVLLLSVWPVASAVFFGGLVAANFVSTGIALIGLARR
ncbi:hypothetical protein R5H30_20440 [Sulfitobacter sp. D35]|uniref:hypothetical protein n=1 Tax=Sulfitobacter sp. D35 TaxID=3083252 RepID=UPI00296E4988|nr:hypothetical protein [Sulfitobacter sp. D35]MDW4500369.1 hypothetical protein [Sulfitobacter sp. D35]